MSATVAIKEELHLHRSSQPFTTALFALISIIFSLNFFFVNVLTPGNIQMGEKIELYKSYGEINVYDAKNLRSGGIGLFSVNTLGYVNLFEEESNIYINSSVFEKNKGVFYQSDFIYRHEIGHIYQKKMVAEKAGGYPSWNDPLTTIKYVYYLFKLDSDYKKMMPDLQETSHQIVVFPGLEAASDCMAIRDNDQSLYKKTYVVDGKCTLLQDKIATASIVGRWPDEQLEKEKNEEILNIVKEYFNID